MANRKKKDEALAAVQAQTGSVQKKHCGLCKLTQLIGIGGTCRL